MRNWACVFVNPKSAFGVNRLTRTGDAVTDEAVITRAYETPDGVSTSSVGVAVVCADSAFVDICMLNYVDVCKTSQ